MESEFVRPLSELLNYSFSQRFLLLLPVVGRSPFYWLILPAIGGSLHEFWTSAVSLNHQNTSVSPPPPNPELYARVTDCLSSSSATEFCHCFYLLEGRDVINDKIASVHFRCAMSAI